jgi:hypothetical protein
MWSRQHTGDGRPDSAAGVARTMVDAVSFLIGVAARAGLDGIATKLSAVRVDLVAASYDDEDHDGPGRKAEHSHAGKAH